MRLKCIPAAILALTLLLLILSGCNKASSPRDAIELFTKAMNENDYKTAFAYVSDYDGFGFDEGTEQIINAVSSSMSISIVNESSSASSSIIETDVTTIDLRDVYCNAASAVIPQFYSAALAGSEISTDDISARMLSEVTTQAGAPGAPTVTTRVVFMLNMDSNGKWVIKLDVTAYNAITGYLDEANNLITTGTIIQAINGETDFLSGELGANTPGGTASPSDVSGSNAP